MKKNVPLLVLLIAVLGFSSCASTDNTRTISVSGKGIVSVQPDMAAFSLTVTQLGATTSEAQNATNEKIAEVMGILKDNGVENENISTTNLSLYADYSWKDNIRILNGQCCSQTLQVKVRNLDALGKIIDNLGAVNEIEFGSISFDKWDKRDAYLQARKAAVEDAVAKARVYATSFNLVVGNPLAINEGSYESQPLVRNAKSAMMLASDTASTETPVGNLNVEVAITVVFGVR